MHSIRRLHLPLLVLTVCSTLPAISGASINSQTYTGSFPAAISGTLANQGTALEETFTLPTSGPLTVFTSSYATGGFEPNLTLYNSAGNFIAGPVVPGTSPVAAKDPSTGMALDAYLTVASLAAGQYTVALTDFQLNQSPTATNLSDGFSANYGNGVDFIDQSGHTRSGSFALTLDASGTPSSLTPEPASLLLVAPFFLGFGFIALKKSFCK